MTRTKLINGGAVVACLIALAGCQADEGTEEDVQGSCTPTCVDIECGNDGCDGSCGECSDGLGCVEGRCVSDCSPSCSGRECGDDGCGGSCGGCSGGDVCNDGECVDECWACTEDRCASQLSRCDRNSQCPALLECLSGCGSDACMDSCITRYIGGAQDLIDLLECMDGRCSSEC